MSLETDIEELQIQVAFQENLVTQLNEIVTRQDGQILLMQRQLELLSEKLKRVDQGGLGDMKADEPPPHY